MSASSGIRSLTPPFTWSTQQDRWLSTKESGNTFVGALTPGVVDESQGCQCSGRTRGQPRRTDFGTGCSAVAILSPPKTCAADLQGQGHRAPRPPRSAVAAACPASSVLKSAASRIRTSRGVGLPSSSMPVAPRRVLAGPTRRVDLLLPRPPPSQCSAPWLYFHEGGEVTESRSHPGFDRCPYGFTDLPAP